jgi:uncharacterized protein YggU (UPF0235/DUF167 family)
MYIKVKVKAGSRTEEVVKVNEDHYDISVKEKAERNMANNRVCEIMALILGVSKDAVRIINGHHSPSKMLSITIPE